MIKLFAKGTTDFSSNGILILDRFAKSAEITEELNGDFSIEIELAFDPKLNQIENDMVISAPAPRRLTPNIETAGTHGYILYRVQITTSNSGGYSRVYSSPSTSSATLAKHKNGDEVTYINNYNNNWAYVCDENGVSGYMWRANITYSRTISGTIGQVIPPRQTRDQLFRIYDVSPSLEGLMIRAKHIFYDLAGNFIKAANGNTKNVTGAIAARVIGESAIRPHPFNVYADLSTIGSVEIEGKNPAEAMLTDDGLVGKFGGEILRDNFDVYYTRNIGMDRGVTLAYRKNITGMTVDINTEGVKTQIIPIGYTKDGDPIYLDEVFVTSEHYNDYDTSIPRIMKLECQDVKVGDDYANALAVKETIRHRAQEEYSEKKVDMPSVSASVDYVAMKKARQYQAFAAYTDIFLGDTVRIRHEDYGFDIEVECMAYTFDCLKEEFTGIELGTKKAALGSVRIDPDYIPDSSISSRKIGIKTVEEANIANLAISEAKLEDGAVGTDKLADNSVIASKIVAAAITADKIAANAVTADKIAANAITAGKIDAGAITADKIAAGAVTAGKIGAKAVVVGNIDDAAVEEGAIASGAVTAVKISDGAVTANKIAAGAVTTAKIDAGAITADKIAAGAVTAAKIEAGSITADRLQAGLITANSGLIDTGAIQTAQIADGSITDAKIVGLSASKITAGTIDASVITVNNLSADNITTGTINGQRIPVLGTDKLADGAVTGAKVAENAITADKIVTGAVTAAKIAAEAVTANKIAANAVTAAKIEANAITADKIAAGAITTAKVAAGFGSSLDISANSALTAKVDKNGVIAAINLSAQGDESAATINANRINLNGVVTANNYFKINANGSMETISGKVGEWTIAANLLSSGTGAAYVALSSDPSGTYAVWAGNDTAASAPFSVKRNGEIKATSGTIGGWTINGDTLEGGNFNGGTGIGMKPNDANYTFYAGSGNFRVAKNGYLYASNAAIAGTLTSGNWVFASNGSRYTVTENNVEKYVQMTIDGSTAKYTTNGYDAYYGSNDYHDVTIYGANVKLQCAPDNAWAGIESISARYSRWGSRWYEDICFVPDSGGSTFDTAYGNIGTTDQRWDVIWVRMVHYDQMQKNSSRTKKHNIQPMRDMGAAIDALAPVSFAYNDDPKEKTEFGLIYEDTVGILPEICSAEIEGGEEMLGIDYTKLIPVLLNEIKALRARVNALEQGAA